MESLFAPSDGKPANFPAICVNIPGFTVERAMIRLRMRLQSGAPGGRNGGRGPGAGMPSFHLL